MKTDLLWQQATGVGSLPHKESDAALKLVQDYLSALPHWPQLPVRGGDEGFVRQVITPLIRKKLIIQNNRKLVFDNSSSDWSELITSFYGDYLQALETEDFDKWAYPREAALGLYTFLDLIAAGNKNQITAVKGQISGPVTVSLMVEDFDGKAAFYDSQLRDILTKTLELQMIWQIHKLQALQLPVLIFIDDPGIIAYGQSATVGISRKMIQEVIYSLIDAAHKAGALTGVHCCAGIDWSLLLEMPVDVINLDAYGYFPSLKAAAEHLQSFLVRGGIVAWGMVPTGEELLTENPDSLANKFFGYLKELINRGVDGNLLKQQWMITPACGLGTRTQELAETAYKYTNLVTKIIREKI